MGHDDAPTGTASRCRTSKSSTTTRRRRHPRAHRPRAGRHLPLPARRDQLDRAATKAATTSFTTFPEDVDRRPMRQRAGPQADGDRAAARLPRLRAGLRRRRGRLRRPVRPDPRPGRPRRPSPRADDRLLYSLHHGKVPGTAGARPTSGSIPTSPAAARTAGRPTLRRHPRRRHAGDAPFGSPLRGADGGLTTFAFGGANICDPCFADGTTGIPVHLPDGSLVQGMAGHARPGPGGDHRRLRRQSALRRRHAPRLRLDLEIRGRRQLQRRRHDLRPRPRAGVTHVVSKTPAGATMTGPGIGELDISADGSRILIGAAGRRTTRPATATGTST